ncbi:hypothetical protein FB45DRAFT_837262 [Roridomyces roridus]|uniref:Uncharacterized protein n=1 Tax=Roridomyces roridus TaxID=1738132 RepID=A0AAD7BK44_9AGAR|nr:hypothetical protein FB45DRAFT_837262 [Roridomyces roridus]
MAFASLKRFFSIRKKKSRRERGQGTHSVSTPALTPIYESPDDSAEVRANQLLRSSSARYAVVRELDYSSFPPLPHPINNVLQNPGSSTASLASAAPSVSSSTRGTYTVVVHRRTRHAHTEFPNANRGGPDTTQSHMLGLPSDPSVVSLVSLYDEHGRLPARTFSNSPPKGKEKEQESGGGRAQVARSGSTLRQLLGNPSSSVNSRSDASTGEGDISWAERFLGETASPASSTSSLMLPTPDTPDTPLPLDGEQSFTTQHDLSTSIVGISSLEVELSDGPETPPRVKSPVAASRSPYGAQGTQTPQRASQVFGFLTEKRRSRVVEDDERSLPELPSVFSSPSTAESPPNRSHFSSDSSRDSIEPPPVVPATPREPQTELPRSQNEVQVLMANGPTRVILTAPTPSFHQDNTAAPPLRGPRGPRAHRQRREAPTHDGFTALPPRRISRRTSSEATIPVVEEKSKPPARVGSKRRSILAVFEKENTHLSAKQELPRTPIRVGSISRPYQMRGAPPSPASSLELSTAGRELMGDLKQQRRGARERERRTYF